jgi:hypothetical protein
MPADPEKAREFCVGPTPRIGGTVANQVLARMMSRGSAKKVNGEIWIRSRHRKGAELTWFPISQCAMGHKKDVVIWWNQVGRRCRRPGGDVAPAVKAWMNNPNNYVIQYRGFNCSEGQKTMIKGHRYKAPYGSAPAPRRGRRVKPGKGAATR